MRNNFIKVLLLIVITGFIVFVITHDGDNADLPETHSTLSPAASRLAELLGNDGVEGFPLVTEAREFHFPEDHGPHPEYRNEWWYFTGNLDGPAEERFGYELTLFRFALTPDADANSHSRSAWATNQVFMGHFAISDVESGAFRVAQRYARGAAGLAGAQASPFKVWLEDWQIAASDDGAWRLTASDKHFEINLRLEAGKAPVLNGREGLSQKSIEVGNASYYYSVTRLVTQGNLRVADREFSVHGLSWLDREWGSSALSRQQVGWDWFALQLSDGTDLMFYNLRRDDGSQDENSAGTFTDAEGDYAYLARADVAIEVTDYWQNERGDRYPSAWTVSIPGQRLELQVSPVLANQELATVVRYWEGAVDVRGRRAGETIRGRGYVELTGYGE